MRGNPIAVLTIVVAGVLGALPASAGAASALVGPTDLTSGPTTAALECTNMPGSCAWGGQFNTAIGSAAGSLVAPADGTVTSWRVKGGVTGGGAVVLHVIRPRPDGSFLGIANAPAAIFLDGTTPNSGGSAQVQAGDMFSVTAENLPQSESGTARVDQREVLGAAWSGIQILFPPTATKPNEPGASNRLMLYNATVELEPPRVVTTNPNVGPASGGTEVTIIGAHLAVATGVSFGGVPALSFKGDNSTITAVAPPHKAGTVDVIVTTAGGSSGLGAGSSFTYQAVDDGKKPTLKAFGVKPKKFETANIGGPIVPLAKVGATVKYELSEEAGVAFSVLRGKQKRKGGLRWVKLKGSFADAGEAGANSFVFSGRLRGKELAPGRYRLKGVAKDPFGGVSKPKSAAFTIVD